MPGPAVSATKTPVVTQENGITVIATGPEYENLSDADLEELKDAILKATSRAEPPFVVLDLSHIHFFGSAFIESLFQSWTLLNARGGGRLALCGLTDYCREVVDVTHLDRLWPVFATREEAMRSVRN